MTAILPDFTRRIKEGKNIKTPLPLNGGEAYRLGLFVELGSQTRSVLVVFMTLQFQFEDGEDGLKWNLVEKALYAKEAVDLITAVWNSKFRIVTNSRAIPTPLRDVGVLFNIKTFIDGWHSSDDYELNVIKIPPDAKRESHVVKGDGNASLDSNDILPARKGASMDQHPIVHEFGHMLGLKDEYPKAHSDNRADAWTWDTDSVMYAGEVIRPRHYAPFAAWLTQQFRTESKLTRSTVEFQVDGRVHGMWTMDNAALG